MSREREKDVVVVLAGNAKEQRNYTAETKHFNYVIRIIEIYTAPDSFIKIEWVIIIVFFSFKSILPYTNVRGSPGFRAHAISSLQSSYPCRIIVSKKSSETPCGIITNGLVVTRYISFSLVRENTRNENRTTTRNWRLLNRKHCSSVHRRSVNSRERNIIKYRTYAIPVDSKEKRKKKRKTDDVSPGTSRNDAPHPHTSF